MEMKKLNDQDLEASRAIKQKENESSVKVSAEVKQNIFSQIEHSTVAVTQEVLAKTLEINLKPRETKQIQKDQSVYVRLAFTKEQYAKLEKCKNLTAHILKQKNKQIDLANIIEVLASHFIKLSEGQPASKEDQQEASAGQKSTSKLEMNDQNKAVTQKTRQFILKKLKCCQFRDSESGRLCESQFALEVEHITSLWAGGTNEEKNLTLLCSSHNKHKYRKESQLRFIS